MKINWSSIKKVGRFIWFVFFALLIAFLIVSIIYDPGYALFVYDRWSLEMPLWVLAISLVLFYITCRFIVYLFNIPSRLSSWFRKRKEKKGTKQLSYAMYSFLMGELQDAQKSFLLSAKSLIEPLVGYIHAIQIAIIQQDYQKAQSYFNTIKEIIETRVQSQPRDKMNLTRQLVLNILEINLLIEIKDYTLALEKLLQVQQDFPQHNQIIYLLYKIYLLQENWPALLQLLPQLQKSEYFSQLALFQLEQVIYKGVLLNIKSEHPHDAAPMWELWDKIPRHHKKDSLLFAVFIKVLIAFNYQNDAEAYVRKYLKKNWSDDLMYLYGLIYAEDWKKQLAFAEQWLPHYPANAALLITLGRLSERNKIYGKARSYYEEALFLKPCREICWLLAELAENLNDHLMALQWYQKATTMIDESVC